MKPLRLSPTSGSASFGRRDLLRWIFLGRLSLAAGIFVGVVLVWGQARPDQTLIATVLFILALLVTGGSVWWLVVLEGEPGENFCYGQIIFDALLVTGIVHITGGGGSVFAPVYILVVTAGALLLPLRGGILLAVLASILYLGDALWFHEEALTASLVLQLGLFALVALVTGWVGDRLRRAGVALGEVESELRQLRLDTTDILENVATGVLTVDGEGRMAYLNRAGEFLLGVDRDQWMGAPVLEMMEETAPGLGSLLRSSMENEVAFSRFKATTHQDGKEVTLGVSTTILERDGEGDTASGAPSVTALFQDITDQEELDALNWRNARLEAVAELSASLAHEIKNPLA
ncbi:MAG: PAS domain S-box protein, partial [Longimicrobiales bacterium]